jgi:hypothetical protein
LDVPDLDLLGGYCTWTVHKDSIQGIADRKTDLV